MLGILAGGGMGQNWPAGIWGHARIQSCQTKTSGVGRRRLHDRKQGSWELQWVLNEAKRRNLGYSHRAFYRQSTLSVGGQEHLRC